MENINDEPLCVNCEGFGCPICGGTGYAKNAFFNEESETVSSFQHRVYPWMKLCFAPEVVSDLQERNARFMEEALELVQSTGLSKEDVLKLVDYVYSRPVGEPKQEVGGVMVTLAALCCVAGLDMAQNGEDELTRINTPEIIEKIRIKQATKPHASPLPGTYEKS